MSSDATSGEAAAVAEQLDDVSPADAESRTDTATAAAQVPDHHDLPIRTPLKRTQIQTVRLDARDVRPSWPLAIASLEQLSGWAVLALRLGTLALIQQCVRELAQPDAPAELVVRLRVLTDALAHMPLEA